MLTPQEVSERSFSKASFGGYNMSQVDEFLDILTHDYSSLYSDNAVLKSKMKVLVDKVEEYRATEEAMRKALMTAQRMADELVGEAEQQKAKIIESAESEARKRAVALAHEVEVEEERLHKAQEATAAFVTQVRAAAASQLTFLDKLEELCPKDAPAEEAKSEETPSEAAVEETANEIDGNVQRLLAQAMSDTAEPRKAPEKKDMSDTAEFTPCKTEQPAARPAPAAARPAAPAAPAHAAPAYSAPVRRPAPAAEPVRRPAPAAAPTASAPRAPRAEEDVDMSKTRRIDLNKLQFGRDYEVR